MEAVRSSETSVTIYASTSNHVFEVILGFRSDVDEICVLLGSYAASSGNPLPTFRDNLLVPSSRVKKSNAASLDFLALEDGTAEER
jgi:hypothetical protein